MSDGSIPRPLRGRAPSFPRRARPTARRRRSVASSGPNVRRDVRCGEMNGSRDRWRADRGGHPLAAPRANLRRSRIMRMVRPRNDPKSAAQMASHHSCGTVQRSWTPLPHPSAPTSGMKPSAPTNVRRRVSDLCCVVNASRRFSSERDARRSIFGPPCSFASRRARRRPRLPTGGGYRFASNERTFAAGTTSAPWRIAPARTSLGNVTSPSTVRSPSARTLA